MAARFSDNPGLQAVRLAIADWIARESLDGLPEDGLLAGVAERLVAAGLPLTRMVIGTDTLHPVIEGTVFRWDAGRGVITEKYDRVQRQVSREARSASPFFHLYETGSQILRRRLEGPHHRPGEFPVLDRVRGDGGSDYVAFLLRFGEAAAVGEDVGDLFGIRPIALVHSIGHVAHGRLQVPFSERK